MFMVNLLSAGMSGVVMYMMTSLPKSIVPWINTPVTWLRSSTRFVSPYPSLSGVEGMSSTGPCLCQTNLLRKCLCPTEGDTSLSDCWVETEKRPDCSRRSAMLPSNFYLLTRLVEMHAVVTEEGAVPRDIGMLNHPADVHTRYQLPPHSVHLLSLDLDSFL